MTQKLSATLANQLANTIATTFNDGFLDLYDGLPGDTPEDVSKGTLLATMKLPMAAYGTAVNGVLTLAGQWFGTAVAASTATWGRFRDHGNTIYLVVIVSGPGGGGEIILDNPALLFGDVVEVMSFTYTVPMGD